MSRRPQLNPLFAIAMLSGLVLAPFLAWAPAVRALEPSRNRWPNPLEKGEYRARVASTGQVLWQVSWETRVTEDQGQTEVEIHEQGRGRPWRYKEPITWEKRMVFAPDPAMRVESLEGVRWTSDGNVLSEVDLKLDPQREEITYVDSDAGSPPVSAVFRWKPQMLPDELLFYWVRMLPFGEGAVGRPAAAQCTLVVSPTRRFQMDARVRGTEVITTPAGTFSCYRVDLSPRLMGPLRAMAPRMSLWCATEPPHYWVRYQGPVGGPGSPQAIIELVKFEQEQG